MVIDGCFNVVCIRNYGFEFLNEILYFVIIGVKNMWVVFMDYDVGVGILFCVVVFCNMGVFVEYNRFVFCFG